MMMPCAENNLMFYFPVCDEQYISKPRKLYYEVGLWYCNVHVSVLPTSF